MTGKLDPDVPATPENAYCCLIFGPAGPWIQPVPDGFDPQPYARLLSEGMPKNVVCLCELLPRTTRMVASFKRGTRLRDWWSVPKFPG